MLKIWEKTIIFYLLIYRNIKNIIKFIKMIFLNNNFKIFILLIFFLNSCVSLPGIVKNPSKKEPNSKIISSNYSMNDVGINIVKINSIKI